MKAKIGRWICICGRAHSPTCRNLRACYSSKTCRHCLYTKRHYRTYQTSISWTPIIYKYTIKLHFLGLHSLQVLHDLIRVLKENFFLNLQTSNFVKINIKLSLDSKAQTII